jgi:hypothetical protein
VHTGVVLPSSVQRFQPGPLAAEVARQFTRLQDSKTISRFWNRDIHLWSTYRAVGKFTSKVLGWPGLEDHLEGSSELVSHLGQSLEVEGFADVVFLAVSSSSPAAELVASLGLRTSSHGRATLSLCRRRTASRNLQSQSRTGPRLFFLPRHPEGPVFLQSFGWNLPWVKECGRSLAPLISSRLGVPTEFVDGPRYLHIHGQCYKGGPRGGLDLMITCDPWSVLRFPVRNTRSEI